MAIDGNKLQELIGKMFGDVGAAMGSALVLLGDKFGFYKTLAAAGPMTPAELASKTGTVERYVREWAAQQAAAGYINYDATSGSLFDFARAGAGARRRKRPGVFPRHVRDCRRDASR